MKMMGRSLVATVFLGFQLSILVGPTRTRASDWLYESGSSYGSWNRNSWDYPQSSSGADLDVEVTALEINVLVEDHYARTEINAEVRNKGERTVSYTFSQVVPDGAYISRYEMTIDGKKYLGDTEEKNKAQERYDTAVSEGLQTSLVRQGSVRNNFNIDVNLKAGKVAKVVLMHELLLTRRLNKYEYAVYLLPPGFRSVSIPTRVNLRLKLSGDSKFSKFVIDQPDDLQSKDDEDGSENTNSYDRIYETYLTEETIMRLKYEVR